MRNRENLFTNEYIMLTLVIINTIVIFISGFYPQTSIFTYIDCLFTIVFLVEAFEKIRTWSWKRYWSSGWNKFDFILVLLAFPSLLNLFGIEAGSGVVLALRSLRVFKTFRLIRIVPNINSLINGVRLAIRSSAVVALGLLVILFVCSILTSSLFGELAPAYFRNPAISFYNIFRVFTIEGWYEIPDTIASNSNDAMGTFARIYFSVLLFCGGILGMSLVNSIFVDAMAADNNDEVLRKLEELEKKIDELKNNPN